MFVRKLRLLSIVFAAIVLTADLAWPLGFRLSETKEQLKLKYDVSVPDHGTGRVTVNVTIVEQGWLTPLKSAAIAIPSEDRTDRYDVTPLAIKTVDGKLLVPVELKKEVVERAEVYLETSTLDGKRLSQIWYYHAIPIAKYVKNGERKKEIAEESKRIIRVIHRGGFPGETRVVLSGERESVAEAIQREISRKLTEAGAGYSNLKIAVAENLDNAKVSFQGLRNFRNADGTITDNASGHFMLSLSPNGHWDGELGGTRFTLEASALAVDPQTAPTKSPSSAPTNLSEDGDRKRPQDPQPSRMLAVEGERQDVPFPNVDESVIDPEISALVVERIAKTSGKTQDLNRTNEIDQSIVAKGTNAVSTLIAMAQKAANTDPLVLGKSQDFGNDLQCPVDMLVAIGDRRAIPLFSALMKFDTKPRRMFTSLARLLCHGTDKQIELDAKSRDPNLARVAETILRRPEQYKYYKDLYRKK